MIQTALMERLQHRARIQTREAARAPTGLDGFANSKLRLPWAIIRCPVGASESAATFMWIDD